MSGNTCVASMQGVVTLKVNHEVTGMKREVVQNRTKKFSGHSLEEQDSRPGHGRDDQY